MEIISVILIIVILFQFIFLYKMSQKTKFKLSTIKTTNDMQQYLQLLDNKFESKYSDMDDAVSILNQQIENFTKQANMAVVESSEHLENMLLKNKVILDEQSIQIQEKIALLDKFENKTIGLLETIKAEITLSVNEEISPIKSHIIKDFEKLKRYENGYDQQITKRYNNEIFRLLDYIKKERIKNNTEALNDIEEDILIMLENNGIEKLNISVGELYTDELDQYVVVEYVSTSKIEDNQKIKDIKKYGYFLNFLNTENEKIKKPIREARIVVYKFEKKESYNE